MTGSLVFSLYPETIKPKIFKLFCFANSMVKMEWLIVPSDGREAIIVW